MTTPAVVETKQEIAPVQQAATPASLIAMAVQQGADIDKLQKLMELQERWEANEARKAFNDAVAAFKANPPVVVKDMLNKQYGSHYSSLANIVNTTNEALSPHGLNAHWEFEQTENTISVTCILSHRLGHSERVTLCGPPDTSGSKNPIQQIKSTTTYLRGATFEAVTGIASREGNSDDDGNGSGEVIIAAQVGYINQLLADTGSDVKGFLKHIQAQAVERIRADQYDRVVKLLEQKKAKLAKEQADA